MYHIVPHPMGPFLSVLQFRESSGVVRFLCVDETVQVKTMIRGFLAQGGARFSFGKHPTTSCHSRRTRFAGIDGVSSREWARQRRIGGGVEKRQRLAAGPGIF